MWGGAEEVDMEGWGGEMFKWKLMVKREENEGGGQKKIYGEKNDQAWQGGRLRNGARAREKRCYFKTILTDNVTLLQSAKHSCHAPA